MDLRSFEGSSNFEQTVDDEIQDYILILKQNFVSVFSHLENLNARDLIIKMVEDMKFIHAHISSDDYNRCMNHWKNVFKKEVKELQDCLTKLDFAAASIVREKIYQNILLKNNLIYLVYSD